MELDSRVFISRKYCLMLVMGDNLYVFLKFVRVICILFLRFVLFRKGWMVIYKERYNKILNMD